MSNADVLPESGLDPRVRRSREKILSATRTALAEFGYDCLTIEGVAERAGVGKATIYRHWASKARLVIDAASHLRKADDLPTTGSAFECLCRTYESLAGRLNDPQWSRTTSSLMDAARRDPELGELYRDFVISRRAPSRQLLREAVEVGELPADTDVDAAIDLIAGPLFYRRFFTQRPADTDDAVELVRRVFADPPRLPATG